MTKKLTITVDDDICQGLHCIIGRRRISRFLNDLVRPTCSRRGWPKALAVAALLFSSPCIARAQSAPAELAAAIKGFRKSVLGDPTRINFCEVDMFWKSDGTPVDGDARPLGRYVRRSQCAPPKNELPLVMIASVTMFADSIVVEGATRIGGVARAETYVFGSPSKGTLGLPFRQFRIGALTYYD